MNKKENELIFEQYVKPRNKNKRRGATIVEALDHVMSLPRVERHGRTLVSEADLLDVLTKLQARGMGSGEPNSDELEAELQDYRDNGMWPADDDGRWNNQPGLYPKKGKFAEKPAQPQDEQPQDEQPADDQPQDEQPADDQVKIDVDTIDKLKDAAGDNGQIDLIAALRIIAGE